MGRASARITSACAAALSLLGAAPAAASTLLDPLGGLALIDPLTLDSGLLGGGVAVRGGAGDDGGALAVALEAPFYRELSLQVGWQQDLWTDRPDGHSLSWRLRMPVIQTASYGEVDALLLHYRGAVALREVDPLAAAHEAGVGHVVARPGLGAGLSHHQQLAALVRAPDEADGRARAGLVVREAVIVGLGGRPTDRGAWALSLSLAELELRHYGLVSRADGRMDLHFAAPGLHLGRGRQSWSLSLAPRYRLAWGAAGAQSHWAGVAGLRYGHSPTLE
jgi:hypothetical protein